MFCWTPLPRLPGECSYLIWGASITNNSSFRSVGNTQERISPKRHFHPRGLLHLTTVRRHGAPIQLNPRLEGRLR